MPKTLSPLAPRRFPRLPPLPGVRLAAGRAGIRYKGRRDLLLVELDRGTAVAGVFTRSSTASAPVTWCRRALRSGRARALVVNSGNANAFTGGAGDEAVEATAGATAELVGCRKGEVYIASTGVIGEALPVTKLTRTLPGLKARLASGGWKAAAEAIRTTDTYPKGAARIAEIDGSPVAIIGIAKGSGMIAPDMATLLAFLFTDAKLPAAVSQALLTRGVRRSFNAITVDGDTSTSDTVLMFATGKGSRHGPVTDPGERRLRDFRAKLDEVMVDLAQQIVRDGEGASKFVAVTVTGATSPRAARRIALAIANSPLVKTAIAGGDPNWGRVVMAVGKAGEKVDPGRLAIRIGDAPVAVGGAVHPDYDERLAARHMAGREIAIAVDVGTGRGRTTVWTCDLTRRYVDINADYRS